MIHFCTPQNTSPAEIQLNGVSGVFLSFDHLRMYNQDIERLHGLEEVVVKQDSALTQCQSILDNGKILIAEKDGVIVNLKKEVSQKDEIITIMEKDAKKDKKKKIWSIIGGVGGGIAAGIITGFLIAK